MTTLQKPKSTTFADMLAEVFGQVMADAQQQARREKANRKEIDQSQKAHRERMRDKYWCY